MEVLKINRLVICGILLFAVSCGENTSTNTGSGQSTSPVTATVSAGEGLESFSYHNSTAYKANFGATGVSLSAATSASTEGDIASYSWEQASGPTVTFTSDTTSSTATFDIPAMTAILHVSDQYKWQVLPVSRDDAILEFRLTATDAASNSDKTTFKIYLYDNDEEVKTTTGLSNVGIGEKVYLAGAGLKTGSTASSTVSDWVWTLTPPDDSSAALSNGTSQIANFTPDIAGTYTINYTATENKSDGTTAAITGSLTVTASSFVGVGTMADATPDEDEGQCGACHNGGEAADITSEWQATGHASMFQQVIGYYKSYAAASAPYCWECHTTGYNTSATNGGFDDLVTAAGYSFPSAGTTWSQFTADNPTLTPLTNIQCENCHGPGADHKGDTSRIAKVVWNSGICGKCHPQEKEWKVSVHNSTGVIGGRGAYQSYWVGSATSAACVRCHTSGGFEQEVAGETHSAQNAYDYGVGCAACHDPHSIAADTPSGGATSVSGNDSTQLRIKGLVTMKDAVTASDTPTQVDVGKAAVCYSCHDGFYAYDEQDCDSDGDGIADALCTTIDQAATQYFRTPHNNVQALVLEGKGAITAFSSSAYNFTLTENSFHTSDLFTLRNGSGNSSLSNDNDKCVTCHMGTTPEAEDEGYLKVGGHTWNMENGEVKFTAGCTSCHTTISDFNRTARADYDGDGDVEGIQDEIKGLLLALSTKIRAIDATNISSTSGTTQAEDGAITVASLSYSGSKSNTTSPDTCSSVATPADYKACTMASANIDLRRAAYNHNLIANDGSLGVHNAAFAVQLLQKTYTAISTMNSGNSFTTDYPGAVIR